MIRNDTIWEDGNHIPEEVGFRASHLHREYMSVMHNHATRRQNQLSYRNQTTWVPPQDGFCVNVDGATFERLGCIGVGIVIRDSSGDFVAGKACRRRIPPDPFVAEAMASIRLSSYYKVYI